jgi:hypothetical protein
MRVCGGWRTLFFAHSPTTEGAPSGCNSTQTYCYDGDGNLLNDGLNAYTYDAEGRIMSINGGVKPGDRRDVPGAIGQ